MKTSEGFVRADSRNLPKVDITMLLEYMHQNDVYNAAEIRGAKVLMSTRDSYVDSAIGYVEVRRENTVCTVKARVTPEHRIRTKMYCVVATVNEHLQTLEQVACDDCAASVGGCKHGICFVQWLIKKSEEPPVTSITCYWNKPKLSESTSSDNILRVTDMGKKRKFKEIETNITVQSVLEECKKRNVSESLLYNYSEYKEKCLNDYNIFNIALSCLSENNNSYDSLQMYGTQILSKQVIDEIKEATRTQTDSVLWHSLRQGRITASNVYNVTRCTTADGALVKSIMGGYKAIETKAMKRGKKLEKLVIQKLKKELKIEIRNCGLVLFSPIMGASPDGVTDEFVVEIKCPSKNSTIENYITHDHMVKDRYKSQIMLQMYATKRNKGLFVIADPKFEENNKIISIWVDYDDNYLNNLVNGAERFWQQYIFSKITDFVTA